MNRTVLVKCLLSRGSFPNQFIFTIDNGVEHQILGTAPRRYCLSGDGKSGVAEIKKDQSVSGFVVGMAVGEEMNGNQRVYLPDSEIYEFPSDDLVFAEEPEGVLI